MLETAEYMSGMNIGLGYTPRTKTVHPVPALININSTRNVFDATGQKVYFQVELLKNNLSLSKQLKVSASASLTYAMTASGSAKATFMSSFKFNSYSVYVLVRVNVENQHTLLDLTKVKFNEEAIKTYTKNPQEFNKIYGSTFVYGIITGGDYYGILEIESKSEEEHREIKASLSGKATYGLFSGQASVSFEQSLTKITSTYHMKAHVLRDGGQGGLQNISPEQLINDALAFPGQLLGGKGIPLSVLLLPYENLPHPGVIIEPCSREDSDCLNRLGENYEKLKKKQNDLIYALENKEYFPDIDETTVTERIKSIQIEMKAIEENAAEYTRDPSKCNIPELKQELLDYVLPKQVQPSRLGNKWYIELGGGYLGIYERNGETNRNLPKFTGGFIKNQILHSGYLEFHELGNEIYFYRKDDGKHSDDYAAFYKGTFSEDGNKASGIELSNEKVEWTATIIHNLKTQSET